MRVSAGPFSDPRQLSTIDELLRETPEEIGLRFGRACCLEDLGRTSEAIAAYDDVLQRQPAHLGALTNLGALLFERGQTAAAQPYFLAAAERYPADPVALINLARLQVETGEFDAAIAGYTSVLAGNPDSLHARLGLAALYRRRGDEHNAALHFDRAIAKPRIWRYPYHGSAPPLKVILLASAFGGDVVSHLFLDDDVVEKCVLLADSVRADTAVPAHHVIFNAIGDADRAGPSLERAQALCAASDAPTINDPRAVARSGRVAVMERLRGLPFTHAPRTESVTRAEAEPRPLAERGFAFPLLLRSPGHHAGMHLALIERAEDLAAAVAELPGRDLLALEYFDARGPDGNVRKYRVMTIDGRLYPLHLAISPQWKVHYFSADMADRPDHRAEEAAFLRDMPGAIGERAVRALEAIAASLGLDFAGIDFALDAEGNVLVFEANAAMGVYLPDAAPIWDYRRPAVDRIINAVRTMLVARARTAGYRGTGQD